jgi:hypothetical protein
MARLEPVLTARDLPIPELMAARLDGELAVLDGAWTPVDEIEQPRHRALSLALRLPDRVIIEQRSAAWVWGAIPMAPAEHQLCAAIGARVRPGEGWPHVREVVIDDDDVWTLGVARVTSPARTIVDLARFAEPFDDEVQQAVHALLRVGRVSIDDCIATMDGRRNLPSKRRARARLWSLRQATTEDYAELTRYTS